jgi:NTE family protein
MYGAYQAGAWKTLADVFRPDLVVGASIGAVNGWAIAGGCSPSYLIDRWLNLHHAARYRWQAPKHWTGGVLDSGPLLRSIEEIHSAFQPKTEFAMIATDLLKLHPRIFLGPEITWRHLAASTAIVGIFEQVRIDGTIYSDGGLLSALPVWVAAELGATRILAVNALPEAPGQVARVFVSAMKLLSKFKPAVPDSVEVLTVTPRKLLGSPVESIHWKRENVERWIEQGAEDAQSVLRVLRSWDNARDISLTNCFERK